MVEEVLGFEPSGSGEHVLLQIQKKNLNTMDVVDRIASVGRIPKRDVGLCGLKDRDAMTTQWFSATIPVAKEPVWESVMGENVVVLQVVRHAKKLRRGIHLGNRFKIKVRDLNGDISTLEKCLDTLVSQGVPNYFGAQRFGRQNLAKAELLFAGKLRRVSRSEKSMLLSAVRSQIFNEVLAERVRYGCWNRLLAGDVANLNRTNSIFTVETMTPQLQSRLEQFDVHPTGPLYGVGENPMQGSMFDLEKQIFSHHPVWCEGLTQHGARMQRRPLRVALADFSWVLEGGLTLGFEFFLPRGSYATTVLSELIAD